MDVLDELEKAGAVYLNQHFVYKSGKHGPGYIAMDALFPHVSVVAEMCKLLVSPYRTLGVQTVAAPATGGIELEILSVLAFARIGASRVKGVWADKAGDDFVFERAGFADWLAERRVLVVEDLLTTGGSVAKTCRLIEAAGGEIVGVSAICNRGRVTAEDIGVTRLNYLSEVDFDAFEAADCPLCREQQSIVIDASLGHGARFQVEHPKYPGGYVELLAA